MSKAPSRRMRLRVFDEDERALDEAIAGTALTSKSSAVRAALTFFDQAWSSQQSGFRVLYWHPDSGEGPGVLDEVFARHRRRRAESDEDSDDGNTGAAIEVRLTPADEERVERLVQTGAADNASQAVRRAIRLYAAVAARCRDGWSVVAVSPLGDRLPASVPGVGAAELSGATFPTSRDRPCDVGNVAVLNADIGAPKLPLSLLNRVKELAAREGCSVHLLLVDMIRAETLARLTGLNTEPPAVERVPAAEPETPARQVEDDGETCEIDELAVTLEQMADSIEKVMHLIGETNRSKGQQAQFEDLLFGTAAAMSGSGETRVEVKDDITPVARLSRRAKELDDRLATLVALSQRERKRKTPKGGPKSADARNAAEASNPSQKAEWAVTLSADESGAPQQQVVGADTVVPLANEDLDGI